MAKKKVLNKKKKKGIAPFEITHEANILRETADGGFVTDEFVPIKIKSSLKIMGRTCTAEGRTVQEAILNLKPEVARGVGVLTLERAELKKEKIIQSRIINNLYGKFVSNLSKQMAFKQITMYFNTFK